MISIDDFHKLEIRIGEILSVEKVPETDKLLKLSVNFGEEGPRQIISGIAPYFEDIQTLVGKKCPFLVNLEYRTIKGNESQGMILAASDEAGNFSLLEANINITAGTKIK